MTIAIKGNAQGGVIEANGVAAANVSSASGMPFMKNKLINGEVTRINQRGAANWAAVANGAYGYDRWKKVDASNMTQIIEAGNFRPNTVHTLSGIGVTTQQITSPASGNWTLPNIPIAAANVQVEEGLEATPFEVRHIGFELALCQRYYEQVIAAWSGQVIATAAYYVGSGYKVQKRAIPTISSVSQSGIGNGGFGARSGYGDTLAVTWSGTAISNTNGAGFQDIVGADAEL